MRSDMSKPDLSESLLECPLTLWDAEGIDLDAARESAAKLPAACPLEIRATEEDNKKGEEYFSENKDMIRQKLLEVRGSEQPTQTHKYTHKGQQKSEFRVSLCSSSATFCFSSKNSSDPRSG